ncbi:hypothetical protein GOBAR_DD33319 [Gossypium barbadense]|nr:hypothetical protein GOBAR_DD33319 [Gossypium barbadense]
MNRQKVVVGGLGFVFALNMVQHHRLGIAAFFSMVSVVMIDVHGCLVGKMSGLGCRMSEVVRQGKEKEVVVLKVKKKEMGKTTAIRVGLWFLLGQRGCGGEDGGDSSESMVTKVGAEKRC